MPAIIEMDTEAFSRVSAVIEALCAEAYRTTTEAFYETALKNRYTRDDDARRMIDIIYGTSRKSFLMEYGGQSNNIGGAMVSALEAKTSVTSYLESGSDAAQNKINEFIITTMQAAQQG